MLKLSRTCLDNPLQSRPRTHYPDHQRKLVPSDTAVHLESHKWSCPPHPAPFWYTHQDSPHLHCSLAYARICPPIDMVVSLWNRRASPALLEVLASA